MIRPLVVCLILVTVAHGSSVYNPQSQAKPALNRIYETTHLSKILQGRMTITLSQSGVTVKFPIPPKLNQIFTLTQPVLERFELPTGVNGAHLDLSLVDHISLYYNPMGALPFPAGSFDATPVNDLLQKNARCLSCYLFFTFHLVSQSEAASSLGSCRLNDHFFCDPEESQDSSLFALPPQEYLPGTFSQAEGTMYKRVPLVTPYNEEYKNYTTCSPLVIPELGHLWVSTVYPAFYTPTLIKASNYYLTSSGKVLGIGQAISTGYFQVLSNKDTPIAFPDDPGFFDTPTNYTQTGGYPATPISRVQGRGNQAEFTFGYMFKNVTADEVFSESSSSSSSSDDSSPASLGRHLPTMVTTLGLVGLLGMLLMGAVL